MIEKQPEGLELLVGVKKLNKMICKDFRGNYILRNSKIDKMIVTAERELGIINVSVHYSNNGGYHRKRYSLEYKEDGWKEREI